MKAERLPGSVSITMSTEEARCLEIAAREVPLTDSQFIDDPLIQLLEALEALKLPTPSPSPEMRS